MKDATNLVGQSISRIDGPKKVKGEADYTADYNLPQQLWAVAVKSTVAKGEIASLDSGKAEQVNGVVKVYHADNLPKIYPPKKSGEGFMIAETLPPLTGKTIHYYGQDIAYVVAESYEAAREGAGLVEASYHSAPPVLTLEAAQLKAPEEVNGSKPHLEKKADSSTEVSTIWERSPVKVDVTYLTPIVHHHPMEPHAVVAAWEDDRLKIYTPTQWMYGTRNFLAKGLGVPGDHVRVISHYLGGAFGCKGASWMYSLAVAAFARDLKRPVKFVMERENMFNSVGYRPMTTQRIQIGAQADGKLTALRHLTKSSNSEVGAFVEGAGHAASQVLYESPNIEIDQQVYALNLNAPTFMRAPGECPGVYALESAMDELAVALKMDPLALRLQNMTDQHPMSGLPFSSRNLAECYQEGSLIFGWNKRKIQPGSNQQGDWLIGWGMASATYPAHRSTAKARVRLLANGSAEVQSATQDLGTGTYTIMAQTAADELGLPLAKITVKLGDSSLPEAPVSGGSQSTASVLPAVAQATRALLKLVKELAISDDQSVFKGMKAEDLVVSGEGLESRSEPGKHETFTTLLARSGQGALEATEEVDPAAEMKQKKEQSLFSIKTTAYQSFGAFFVEARVHALTKEVRLNRIVAVMDIGLPINLKTARSQIMGGAAFGIGAGLMEHSIIDEKSGRWITHDLGTYHVPVNADYPAIEIKFVGPPDYKFNPLGGRGVGEIGNTGLAAAIGNAVYHATGARIRELPITVDKLLVAGSGVS